MALTGKTIQHPNFHTGPSLDSPTTAVLDPGVVLQLVGLEGDYFRVILPDQRVGFVHRDLVVVDGMAPPPQQVQGQPQAIVRGQTIQHPNFHVAPDASSQTLFVLDTAVGLDLLGLQNNYWFVRLADGRTGYVSCDLVVAARGTMQAGTMQTASGVLTLSVGNPFDEAGYITASSHQQHHVVYGGTVSFDIDTAGPSRGTPVHFRLSCDSGVRVRGHVDLVNLSCKDGILANGGRHVSILIEREQNGAWVSTGQHVHYAHIDPLNVVQGQVIEDGFVLGPLGPAIPAGFSPSDAAVAACRHEAGSPMLDEFHSQCAVHSHTHIEGTGTPDINDEGVVCGANDVVMRMRL